MLLCVKATAIFTPLMAVNVRAEGPRLREKILCEAYERLHALRASASSLDEPHRRDAAQIQITVASHVCDTKGGSDRVPVTYGSFDVEGAMPIDIFNALSGSDQQSWDSTVSRANILGDWQDAGVRGMNLVYPSGLPFVADREVAEWMAFNASFQSSEFWVAFTSNNNDELLAKISSNSGNVHAQNCLGAYHITPSAVGSHVVFTQHVNAHPPLLSARTIFSVSWGKQVDYINLLRKRSQALAKKRSDLQHTAIPSWLLNDGNNGHKECDRRPDALQLFSLPQATPSAFRFAGAPTLAAAASVVSALLALVATVGRHIMCAKRRPAQEDVEGVDTETARRLMEEEGVCVE